VSSRSLTPTLVSIHAALIKGNGAPEWIELIPAGKFAAVDGRGPFENSNPDSIVAASVARMPPVGLVLDYDHSTDLAAPEGRPSPAAGWLKEFKVDNGAIFARIEWTSDAADAVKAKKYRYVSPVFEHSKDGKVERILRAALTNNPALINLPALASAGRVTAKTCDERAAAMSVKEKKMKLSELMKVLEEAYPDAGPEKLMRAAACLMAEDDDDGDDGDGDMDENMDAADGDPYGSEPGEQMNARHADEMAKCSSDEERDRLSAKHAAEQERFATRSAPQHMAASVRHRNKDKMTNAEIEKAVTRHPMVVAMANEITSMRNAQAKAAATEKVDAAIREGRLIPSQRDWAIAYCASDTDGFEKFLGAQPKIIQSGIDNTFTARIGEAKDEALSAKEMAICQNLGLPSAFGGTEKAIEKFVTARKLRLSHNVHLD
jgi:phage I-like protein